VPPRRVPSAHRGAHKDEYAFAHLSNMDSGSVPGTRIRAKLFGLPKSHMAIATRSTSGAGSEEGIASTNRIRGASSATVESMAGINVGYERVSTDGHALTAQRNALLAAGVRAEQIHVDHGLTAHVVRIVPVRPVSTPPSCWTDELQRR
jgi:hypothetical protein